MQLTPGAIAGILSDRPPQVYTVQCTGIKKVLNSSAQPRFRLMLSDGVHQYVCMLASQLSDMVATQLKENCILQILEYICQFVHTKKVVIVLNCRVELQDCPRIGNPTVFSDPSVIAAPPPGAQSSGAASGNQHVPSNPYRNPAQPSPTAAQAAYGGPQPGHAAAPYGAAPVPSTGAAAPPTYGAPPGAPPQQSAPAYSTGAYGAPPPQAAGAYGAPPPQAAGAYGAPPQQSAPAYGAPPQQAAGAYGGAPPSSKAYGGPPYGAAPPKTEGGTYGQAGQAGFGGIPAAYPAQQQYGAGGPLAQPPQYRGSGPVVRDAGPVAIMPINSLNSYQNRWTIKARVTQKSDIRRYTNARGEGKFFSFDLLDAQGGEIRVVGWNDQVDRWFENVHIGKVYLLSKASLRNKRGNFNQTRHQFEIHLENGTQMEEVGDEPDIPQLHFNFSQISQMEDLPAGQMVDVVGVVESVADWASITKRDGSETQKRSVVIRDESNRSVEVTLWGGYALDPGDRLQAATSAGSHPILAVKNARVGDFNGKTLSTVSSSTVLVDPTDVPEAARLRSWYDNGGSTTAASALSRAGAAGTGRIDRRVTLSQITEEGLGLGGAPAWVQVITTVSFLRNENMYYPACPLPFNGKTCNKKLQDHAGDGSWYCERCAQTAQPDWRYIVSMQVADHTAEAWLTAFNEAAPDILGVPASELRALCEASDPRFAFLVQQACFKSYSMRLKLAEDTYNDETRLRVSLVSASPLDFVAENRATLDLIDKLRRGERVFEKVEERRMTVMRGGGGAYGGGGGGAAYVGGPAVPAYGGQQAAYGSTASPYSNAQPQGYGGPMPRYNNNQGYRPGGW